MTTIKIPSSKHQQQERETSKPNTIFNVGLTSTKDNRYCIHCHIKLVNNPYNRPHDKYIYACPQCGVTVNVYNTEPKEKLVTTFPTRSPTGESTAKKFIHQNTKDNMSRSQYFIQKNLAKK